MAERASPKLIILLNIAILNISELIFIFECLKGKMLNNKGKTRNYKVSILIIKHQFKAIL